MLAWSTEGVPIFSWCQNIEPEALKQIDNLSQLPFAHHHIAIMPDCHSGYGMPIGGVLAVENSIIVPNAIGVDIGCGMCACKTSLTEISTETIKKLFSVIRERIPVGFHHRETPEYEELMPLNINHESVIHAEYDKAILQLGTLGGGNHFIEIQKGSDGHIWIMLHSGSRNLGKKVCDHYNDIAKQLNARWYVDVPKFFDLAFLPINDDFGSAYLNAMNYCVVFAQRNRSIMMRIIQDSLSNIVETSFDETIDVKHNYADLENHYGKNVWVHRKGAIRARKGDIGIIPGSQGSKSYIVRGLGNPESFMSCSHGAGRIMSRTKAKNELNLEEEISKMDGIVHSIRTKDDLEEAASAYKDIGTVMAQQSDLVEIMIELTPLGVVKG